jgi:hypothetical protein
LIAWSVNPLVGDPAAYVVGVMDHLPDAARKLGDRRRQTLQQAVLAAAVDRCVVGRPEAVQGLIRNGLKYHADLFASHQEFVDCLIEAICQVETERPVDILEAVFANLPNELAGLHGSQRSASGRYYAARGFEALKNGQRHAARDWMVRAVRYDLAWLLNRGVQSILLRR